MKSAAACMYAFARIFFVTGLLLMPGTSARAAQTRDIPGISMNAVATAPVQKSDILKNPDWKALPQPVLATSFPTSIVYRPLGKIWIGEGSTLKTWDRNYQEIGTNSLQPPLTSRITAISTDGQRVWVSTAGDGVVQLDLKGVEQRRFGVAEGIPAQPIHASRFEQGRVWLCLGKEGAGEFGSLDLQTGRYTRVPGAPPEPPLMMAPAGKRAFYLSTRRAVYRCDPETKIWTQCFEHGARLLSGDRESGYIAVALGPGGVRLKKDAAEKWEVLEEFEEPPGRFVTALLVDGPGVWLGSTRQVFLVRASTRRIEATHTMVSGMPNYFDQDSNHLWMAAKQGKAIHLRYMKKPDYSTWSEQASAR